MGKTRDLFEKIRDTEGTFHANMGSIKDRNGMDLTEAEDMDLRSKTTQQCPRMQSFLVKNQGQVLLFFFNLLILGYTGSSLLYR